MTTTFSLKQGETRTSSGPIPHLNIIWKYKIYCYCDSMSYDQIRVKPYRVSYSVYHGVAKYGVWYSAECMNWNAKKISCKSLHTIRVMLPFISVCEAVPYEMRMRTVESMRIRRMIRGYGVWVNDSYCVMPYESHTCTGLCWSYKVEWNKWFFLPCRRSRAA